MALENSLQSTEQVFCANTLSAFRRLLLATPDRTSNVEFGLIEVHVRPFQSQGFSNSQPGQVQKHNESLEILRHIVCNRLDLSRRERRLLSPLDLGFRNSLHRIRVQKFQSNREIEHLLQQDVQIQQR